MPPRPRSLSPPASRPSPLAPPSIQLTYVVGRGEQGVLSFEPYKSFLLPLWRFKDPDVANLSSARLEREFDTFVDEGDFVGADMARKFLQVRPAARLVLRELRGRSADPALLPLSLVDLRLVAQMVRPFSPLSQPRRHARPLADPRPLVPLALSPARRA